MSKSGVYFLLAIAFSMAGDTMFRYEAYPLGVFFWLLFIVCVVRLTFIDRACKKRDARLCFKYRNTLNEYAKKIESLDTEIELLNSALNMKADKRNNIHTGSKPNNEYYKMLLEKEGYNADNRTENTDLEEKQGVHTDAVS